MSIHFDPAQRCFRLETRTATYAMQVDGRGHLLHLYYGAASAPGTWPRSTRRPTSAFRPTTTTTAARGALRPISCRRSIPAATWGISV